MAFCVNCGQELAEGAKFCANCGKAVERNNGATQRKTVYDGELHRCPNCGELLNAFITVCPSCAYELRNSKSFSCINEFAQKLEQLETHKQKDDLIRNFYIPNTKEDICEFLILAVSNIKAEDDCEDAWRSKLEQAYQKAKLSFSGDPAFSEMKKLYEGASKGVDASRVFKRILRNKYFIPALLLITGIFMNIFGSGYESMLDLTLVMIGRDLISAAPIIALIMFIYDLVKRGKQKHKTESNN